MRCKAYGRSNGPDGPNKWEVFAMKYDFDSVPDRSRCGSSKWKAAPGADVDHVPLSTADMEFPTAPAIVDGLKQLLDSTILGYTSPTNAYYKAVGDWMARRHAYHIEPDWIITTPGVVYALGMLVDALSEPGDSVIVISPVYYPFDLSVMAKDRNIVYTELLQNGTRYELDFDDLEAKAARPDCRLLLFCSPHNPVGRVWDREELERVVEICARNEVFIIDDEIHHDLILPGHTHTVMATLSETANRICAVCTAPSKTFNLAGVQCSNIIIADPAARAKAAVAHLTNLVTSLNIFAYRACEIAYNECEDWLEELLQVIAGNEAYIKQFMAEHFPEVTVFPLEGTYLLWLDLRALGMTHKELEELMKQEAGLYLDEGSMFGPAGRGFERINLACSRITLEKAMARFEAAVNRRRAQWAGQGKPYHKTLRPGDRLERFVYDTAADRALELEKTIQKPTVLFFSRYYSCPMCQMTLAQLRRLWPEMEKRGLDLKFILQSTPEAVAGATADSPFPFDLICDPQARLYDRFNVFEADSDEKLVAGDRQAMKLLGGARGMLLSNMTGRKAEGRARQLPAVFAVMPDMTVRYVHYARTLTDVPDMQSVLEALE